MSTSKQINTCVKKRYKSKKKIPKAQAVETTDIKDREDRKVSTCIIRRIYDQELKNAMETGIIMQRTEFKNVLEYVLLTAKTQHKMDFTVFATDKVRDFLKARVDDPGTHQHADFMKRIMSQYGKKFNIVLKS